MDALVKCSWEGGVKGAGEVGDWGKESGRPFLKAFKAAKGEVY